MSTLLVTGAAGFVGRRVVADLAGNGRPVRGVVRTVLPADTSPGVCWLQMGDFAEVNDWLTALDGVDAVVHLAGRAHVMTDTAADSLAEHRRANVEVTIRLAEAAAKSGVRRFVFMSSVKAVGESSGSQGFAEDAPPKPEDAYGITKREAEVALLAPGAFGSMSVTVLRPPLVYGPGVRANFSRLMRWVACGIPLPFGTVHNRRSLVFVGNLANAVSFAIDSPALAGQTCFVTDGEDLSTSELIRRLGFALGRAPRLLPLPASLLRAGATLLGRSAEADRLLGSLTLNATRLREAGWRPPFSVDQGLAETATAFWSEVAR